MIHLFICLCMLITICQEPSDLSTTSFILRKLLSFIKHWPAAMHPFTFPSCLRKSPVNLSSTLGIFVRKSFYLETTAAQLLTSQRFLGPCPFSCSLHPADAAHYFYPAQTFLIIVWCFAIALHGSRGSPSSPPLLPTS